MLFTDNLGNNVLEMCPHPWDKLWAQIESQVLSQAKHAFTLSNPIPKAIIIWIKIPMQFMLIIIITDNETYGRFVYGVAMCSTQTPAVQNSKIVEGWQILLVHGKNRKNIS